MPDGVMPANRDRALVVILAGGAGGRLQPLTRRRAKPSLPFAGMYRLIDIALSNVAHSGLQDVWVLEQYEPHALNDHLANGRPWDLDRTHGGMRIFPPFQRHDGETATAGGNADALVEHRRLFAEFGAELVITMSADHLYQLDLRDVIDTHRRRAAALTIVTTDPPADDDPTRFAWVDVSRASERAGSVDDGDVTGFEYKPDQPTGDRVCTEIFAFDAATLLAALDALADDGPAGDYGDRLLPELIDGGAAVEHRLTGYWRDVGTIGAYHRAHMELVADHPPLRLDDPAWPLLTGSIVGGPARVEATAVVTRSLLSPGVLVAGTVEGSVLGRDVVVETGALVRSSVVMDGAVIRAGAMVTDAIVDVSTSVALHDAGDRDADSGVVVFTDASG